MPTKPSPWDRLYAGDKYEPGATGWMVGHTATMPSGRVSTAWWFGPAHGWGTTYGGLGEHTGARVWRTKAQAEAAIRRVYRSLAHAEVTGHRAMRVADAESLARIQQQQPTKERP
jgi:hypothetical protein